MSGVRRFADLRIWQAAREWAKSIYQLTRAQPFAADRRLVDQINDSAASVMANIAEGFGRGTQGEFVQFLGYSLGSLYETQSHLAAAFDREYMDRDTYGMLFQTGNDIRNQTVAFLRSMVKQGSGVRDTSKPKPVRWSDKVWEIYERLTGETRPEHQIDKSLTDD